MPDGDLLAGIITLFVQRKLELFPDDSRLVAGEIAEQTAKQEGLALVPGLPDDAALEDA